jgi:hypothetical protein
MGCTPTFEIALQKPPGRARQEGLGDPTPARVLTDVAYHWPPASAEALADL